MNRVLCRLFGHKLPQFLRNSRRVTYEWTAADGSGHSYVVHQPCARCGKYFVVGYVHARGGAPAPDIN